MNPTAPRNAGRHPLVDRLSARVLDDDGRVLRMRCRRPGGEPYLTTIGGGAEPGETIEDAAHRERLDEADARVVLLGELGRDLHQQPGHLIEHVFLLARLVDQDLGLRHGPELDDPARGGHEPVWLDPTDAECRTLRLPLALELLLGPLPASS